MDNKHLHTEQAGALLPLTQAAITGGLFGLIVLVVCAWQRVRDAWIIALLAWLIITAGTWVILQRHWFALTLAGLENLTGRDWNHDGYIGAQLDAETSAAEPRHRITVDIYQKQPGGFDKSDTARLPFTEAQMRTLAAGLLSGRAFTERAWCGAGKPLSINQFREARAEMLNRGMIELVVPGSPQQGYKLTKSGEAVMRYFTRLSPTTADALQNEPPHSTHA